MHIFIAAGAGYGRHCTTAEEIEQFADRTADQVRTTCRWCMLLAVFSKCVGNEHPRRMPVAEHWTTLMADMIG
jgi:hypothetical protein